MLDRHLVLRAAEAWDPLTATVTVTKQQLAFLIEAIDHFQATLCPLEGRGPGCELLSRAEHASGATWRICPEPCTVWRDYLIGHVVPRAFPARGARRHRPRAVPPRAIGENPELVGRDSLATA